MELHLQVWRGAVWSGIFRLIFLIKQFQFKIAHYFDKSLQVFTFSNISLVNHKLITCELFFQAGPQATPALWSELPESFRAKQILNPELFST